MSEYDKYVIFDLDGTLIDSFATITHCCKEIMRRHGKGKYCPHSFFDKFKHGDLKDMFTACANTCDMDIPVFKAAFDTEYEKDFLTGTHIINSSMEILMAKREQGYGIIVLTNKRQDIAQKICDILLCGNVDLVIGRMGLKPIKPQSNIASMLETLGISPAQCACYYGDSQSDHICAKQLDIKFNQIYY